MGMYTEEIAFNLKLSKPKIRDAGPFCEEKIEFSSHLEQKMLEESFSEKAIQLALSAAGDFL
jgi:hypothetical protein